MNRSPRSPFNIRDLGRPRRLFWRLQRSSGVFTQVLSLILFALVIMVLSGVSVLVTWAQEPAVLQSGQIADRSIRAPSTATFFSELRTEERRQERYDDVRNVILAPEPEVAATQTEALRETLDEIQRIRNQADDNDDTGAINEMVMLVEGLDSDEAAQLLSGTDSSWLRIRSESQRLIDNAFEEEIRAEDVASVKEGLSQQTNMQMTFVERSLSVSLAEPFIRANVTIDEEATESAREAAAAEVEAVPVTVQENQIIVREGDPVTEYDIEKLEFFGLQDSSQSWQQLVGIIGLLGLVTVSLVLYLAKFATDVATSRQLILVGIVVIIPVVAARFVLQNPDLKYMFPAAAAIMLLSILIDFHFAVVIGGFLGLYLGIVSDASFEVAFATILSAIAGAAVIWNAERTITFLWAGFAVFGTIFISATLFALQTGVLDLGEIGSILVSASINGALSASLTFLFFSLLGTLFGITTHLQLLELAHPNQPLLYRLAREAPGTYHHSIVVSNLAESAVERVGGDALFARVAVMYHDIGKVLRPTFFVENQANRANVHDALDPHTSARIILDHVSDGARLARKARIPKVIVDLIEQHHGTTLVKYFYHAALTAGEDVDEKDFRYDGPKPQTKHAGIILLADGVEATVRAMAQSGKLFELKSDGTSNTSVRLKEVVNSIIQERIDDGQLDDCDLTIREIEEIRQVFVSILEGIYHPRIEYPEARTARTEEVPSSDVAVAESS